MPCGVASRSPILETIQLGCACGVELVGGVLANRMKAAVALFVAHHHGPKCAPRWREVPRPALGARPADRLTPDRICGSAWWVRAGGPEPAARFIGGRKQRSQGISVTQGEAWAPALVKAGVWVCLMANRPSSSTDLSIRRQSPGHPL